MSANIRPKPVILAILDGWGVAPPWGGNAITLARTPFMNLISKKFPYTTLKAFGEAVGLPDAERGNSEVGHLNIGAGQIVLQYYPSITKEITNRTFFKNPVLVKAFQRAKQKNTAVHLMGLVSPGGIHSHIDHLYALLDMAKQQNVTNVFIHAVTDGRDSDPFVAQSNLSHLNEKLHQIGFGKICTVAGRYYTMDRDHRWDRIEKSYRAMTEGIGPTASTAEGAISAAYRDGFSDEFIPPTIVRGQDNSFRSINDGDSVIFFNFRGDRAREITQAFVSPDFNGFPRRKVLKDIQFVGFTFYQEGLPMEVAFHPHDVKEPLAKVISDAKLKQLHVAESEKYAHVTYFFNGGNEVPYAGEDRIVIPSPKVASYDQTPQMSAKEITGTVVSNLVNYDFIVVNYANADMVGHTGNLRSTIQACEAVDESLEKIFQAIEGINGLLMVTADHGNAEQKVNPKTGEPDTEHTANPVPLIVTGPMASQYKLRSGGALCDIAPTVLQIMGITPPGEMTGKSLLDAA